MKTVRRWIAVACVVLLAGTMLVSCAPSAPDVSDGSSEPPSTTGSSVTTDSTAPSDTTNTTETTEVPTTTTTTDPFVDTTVGTVGTTIAPTQTTVPPTTTTTAPTTTTTSAVTTTTTTVVAQPTDPVAGTTTVAEVKTVNGSPRLLVNGERYEPIYFMPATHDFASNEALDSEMRYAAQYGVNLLIYPYSWEGYDTPRFFKATMRGVIETMLSYNPDAYLILRLNVTDVLAKMDLNSSEAAYLNGEANGKPSMASDAWYEKAKEILRGVVENVMSDEFLSQYIIGFEILGGNSGEWFEYDYWSGMMDTSESNRQGFEDYLTAKYETDAALQSAWNNKTVTLDTVSLPDYNKLPGINHDGAWSGQNFLMTTRSNMIYIDYFDYLNNQRAERLGGMADVIKEACNDTKLAIVYYGYQFETPTASSGHFATAKLLTYDSVDMLSGPVGYSDRNEGGIGAYMGFTDSVTAAGKMWMDEGDYRSPIYTTEPDLAYPANEAMMNQVMRREVAKCMVFNTGVWWLDLEKAGWFDYESFWKKCRNITNLMHNYANVQTPKSPEIALILDESAMSLVTAAHSYGANGLGGARTTLYKSGYDFGTYLIEDVMSGKVNDAKVYIFLNPWRLSTSEVAAIEKVVHQEGKVALYMYGNGLTSADNFQSLTGMTLKSAEGGTLNMNAVEEISSEAVNGSMSVSPVYYVEDSGVKSLATYNGTGADGKTSLASYTEDGWTSLFYGGTQLTVDMVDYLGDLAGAHRYAASEETVYANDQMVVLHASYSGEKTVTFPAECDIFNLETGEWSTGDSVTFTASRGQTVILFYGKKSDIQKIVGVR